MLAGQEVVLVAVFRDLDPAHPFHNEVKGRPVLVAPASTLYNFTGGSDGANPQAGLILSGR